MPPKLSKSAKLSLIVSHLRATRTCHTLKDLEKMLPSVASINGMQVKDFVQELTDEGLIRVEKIGSGNWYWSFGDERKERERQLSQLQREVERVRVSCNQVKANLARRQQERAGEDEEERERLMGRKKQLEQDRNRLRAEWTTVSTEEGKGIGQMREEVEVYRVQTQVWTDNIYVLEEYVRKLACGDREIIEAVQRECFGEEYVEGEGLRELEW